MSVERENPDVFFNCVILTWNTHCEKQIVFSKYSSHKQAKKSVSGSGLLFFAKPELYIDSKYSHHFCIRIPKATPTFKDAFKPFIGTDTLPYRARFNASGLHPSSSEPIIQIPSFGNLNSVIGVPPVSKANTGTSSGKEFKSILFQPIVSIQPIELRCARGCKGSVQNGEI